MRWNSLLALVVLIGACETVDEVDHGICSQEHGCVEIEDGKPIIIGTLLDFSGPQAAVGEDSRRGVLLAVDYVDGRFDGKAALLGHRIEVTHHDERCTARWGGDEARELLLGDDTGRGPDEILGDDNHLVGVIGTTCTEAALGVADRILDNEGLVLISPSASSPDLTDPEQHAPFFFRTAPNAELEGAAMAAYASRELGAAAAVVIDDGTTYSTALTRAFTRVFSRPPDRTVTGRGRISVADDSLPTLSEIFGGPTPDFVYAPLFAPEAAAMVNAARNDSTFRNTPIGLSSVARTEPFTSAVPDRVYMAGPQFNFDGRFYTEEFLPAYRERFGEPVRAYHAYAFDASMILLEAVKNVALRDTSTGETFISRFALRDAIVSTENYKGITGTLTCDDSGECNPDAAIEIEELGANP